MVLDSKLGLISFGKIKKKNWQRRCVARCVVHPVVDHIAASVRGALHSAWRGKPLRTANHVARGMVDHHDFFFKL